MIKNTKIIIIILLLILENFALVYIAGFYREHRDYKDMVESNQGLTKACNDLLISDNLYSVLQKMKKFVPTVRIDFNIGYDDRIDLSYGTDVIGWSETTGVGLLFDKDYKLSHKSCNYGWEPEVPHFSGPTFFD